MEAFENAVSWCLNLLCSCRETTDAYESDGLETTHLNAVLKRGIWYLFQRISPTIKRVYWLLIEVLRKKRVWVADAESKRGGAA